MPSSVIAKMSYDPASTTLRVIFVSGMVYEYRNVPESVYQAMKNAPSKGTFLNQHIKGTFDFRKIN
jgi:hypothetical protein